MQIELQAYQGKINIPLLNDIVGFVLDTVEATQTQRAALYRRCPLLHNQESKFQEKYQFLYLGELLERYEERFGMSKQDLRSIALALGFTKDFTSGEMFVGNQKENFLRKIQQSADSDLYLNAALYLLGEGQSGATERELKLTGISYNSTEDLFFVLGLFPDQEKAFIHFKPQLLRLLGLKRTMPIIGNMTAWNWLITWLAPKLKVYRGKDMALFRALCALSTSFVKPDGKSYSTLLNQGYTPLEIAYGNMLTVLHQTAFGVLRADSITSEKIAINLFKQVLGCSDSFSAEVYEQLSWIYRFFEHFKIKCNGCSRLLQTLEDGTTIQNPDTFIWFSKQSYVQHQVFQGFDIMDRKWDPLAKALEPEQYRSLFDLCLQESMTQEEVRQRLDRYSSLAGEKYTDFYWENGYGNHFGLLVNKSILDLWSLFQNSLDNAGNVSKRAMLNNIHRYVEKLSTKQAYQFYEKFFAVYGAAGLEKYFGYEHRDFCSALTTRDGYSSGPFQLSLYRDFLDEKEHRKLLSWLEEYIFVYRPEDYLLLITAILQDDFASCLFNAEEQRKLFDLVATRPDISFDTLNGLKRKYLTESELQADQEAKDAARRAAEEQKQAALVQSIRDKYAELVDGSFASVVKFLDQYKYSWRDERPIAHRTVRENLDKLLEAQSYKLTGEEAVQFLHVCNKLVQEKTLSFNSVQEYISKIKEVVEHGT